MATDYPITISDDTDTVRLSGAANFTDPDNQPAPAGPGGGTAPFKPAAGDVVVIVENADGDGVLDYDDDANKIDVGSKLGVSDSTTLGDLNVTGNQISVGGASSNIGFFAANAVPQPVVPLTTPLPQDIIDALVALGLVSQSD